jgi:hypothetical protein
LAIQFSNGFEIEQEESRNSIIAVLRSKRSIPTTEDDKACILNCPSAPTTTTPACPDKKVWIKDRQKCMKLSKAV